MWNFRVVWVGGAGRSVGGAGRSVGAVADRVAPPAVVSRGAMAPLVPPSARECECLTMIVANGTPYFT
ncbi:hypothetical protein SAMN05216564_102263 [Halopenitus persicus]|uniref:Uncharacterized protein n=1 Tax=Halopenitus persicus TaxID=1048396 RepID=A0A1H3FZ94_9EURY|nr:hypothetical protein SAMN05216564_102263 [Halopenitus persicus]